MDVDGLQLAPTARDGARADGPSTRPRGSLARERPPAETARANADEIDGSAKAIERSADDDDALGAQPGARRGAVDEADGATAEGEAAEGAVAAANDAERQATAGPAALSSAAGGDGGDWAASAVLLAATRQLRDTLVAQRASKPVPEMPTPPATNRAVQAVLSVDASLIGADGGVLPPLALLLMHAMTLCNFEVRVAVAARMACACACRTDGLRPRPCAPPLPT